MKIKITGCVTFDNLIGPVPIGTVMDADKKDAERLIVLGMADAVGSADPDPETAEDQLKRIDGITSRNVDVLIKAGIDSAEKLKEKTAEQLEQLDGIGKTTAEKIAAAVA